ncbi:MAG: hypothetical protein JSV61_02525 [Anaerolineales bacterium]|nr:MAG: hypothetical protein JSV61_02525 [Anaerolineales bacterium]
MKKTIWIPALLGIALGIVDFISFGVHWVIQIASFGAIGPQESLVVISAALGGPVGLLATNFLQELGMHIFLLKGDFPGQRLLEVSISIADFFAHSIALLAVAYCYRLLHQRAKKAHIFFAGWILITVIYYIILLPLQSLVHNLLVPDLLPLQTLVRGAPPEFLMVAILSTLLLFALPVRYRRPLWIEA